MRLRRHRVGLAAALGVLVVVVSTQPVATALAPRKHGTCVRNAPPTQRHGDRNGKRNHAEQACKDDAARKSRSKRSLKGAGHADTPAPPFVTKTVSTPSPTPPPPAPTQTQPQAMGLPPLSPGAASAWSYQEPSGPAVLTAEQLRSIGLASASSQGDPEPINMQAVKSDLRNVLEVITDNAPLPPLTSAAGPWLESPAYLLSMEGDFSFSGPTPAGDPAPTGTLLLLAINAHTGEVEGEHLGSSNEAPNLASLGSVESLPVPPPTSHESVEERRPVEERSTSV
jgi:hypothetical protein